MERYQVKGKWVKHKGVMYDNGELLPEDFTERDKYRNLYSSRIVKVAIEIPKVVEVANTETTTKTKKREKSTTTKAKSTKELENQSLTDAPTEE